MTTVAQTLRHGAAILRQSGIENPTREARLLLAHALGCSSNDLLRDPSATCAPHRYNEWLARRAAFEPMAYILGHQGFWSLDFRVSPATLIPRPDSEVIVEAALALPAPATVLDLGTGTGCLLLSVLHERPAAYGVGIDLAPEAVGLAAWNAHLLGLADRALFVAGNWAAALSARFDLVLSNPPYIQTAAIAGLMPDVADYEPATALDGGADGLDAYRAIIKILPDLLTQSGAAVFELGMGQGPAVAALANQAGFAVKFHPDLAGIDRAIVLTKDQTCQISIGRGATAG